MTTEPLDLGWKTDFHHALANGTVVTPGAKIRRKTWDDTRWIIDGVVTHLPLDAHVIVTHLNQGTWRVRGIPMNLPDTYTEQSEWWLHADDWVPHEGPEPEPKPVDPFPFVKGDKIRWALWRDGEHVEITAVGTDKFLAAGKDFSEATFSKTNTRWERYIEPPKRRRWIVETVEEEITHSSSPYGYVIAEDDGEPAVWRSDYVRNGPHDVIVSVREAENEEAADE